MTYSAERIAGEAINKLRRKKTNLHNEHWMNEYNLHLYVFYETARRNISEDSQPVLRLTTYSDKLLTWQVV